MKIFVRKQLVDDLKTRPKIKGVFLPRLFGINIDVADGKVIVEPVFRGLLRFFNGDWHVVLEISFWKEEGWIVFIGFVRPYFKIWKTGGFALDYEEVEDAQEV